jgi:hypothetical protein
MSDTTVTPARPVSLFTIVFLFAIFAAFLLVIRYFYNPVATPAFVAPAENLPKDQAWRADRDSRRKTLAEVGQKAAQSTTGYGWIDQKAGVVRLPIDRAMELTARDLAAKQPKNATRDLPSPSGSGAKF